MYGRERQLLTHVVNTVEEGDTDGVIRAMDEFWATHFFMQGTEKWDQRNQLLDNALEGKGPGRCLELGTYCGYSALRIARLLPADGLLVSIELDPLFAAIATKIIEYAGLRDKVRVLTGSLESRLERVQDLVAHKGDEHVRFGFVLCDHSKNMFVPDLELLEKAGLAGQGTRLMGDTTSYPGESDREVVNLLSHLSDSGKFRVRQHVSTGADGAKEGITISDWANLV